MKHGFIINQKFYHNKGLGHEHNARQLIKHFGWEEQWNNGDAQDFLVLRKGAIQVGSGVYSKKIVVSRKIYRSISKHEELEEMIKKFELTDCEIDFVEW